MKITIETMGDELLVTYELDTTSIHQVDGGSTRTSRQVAVDVALEKVRDELAHTFVVD